MPQHDNPMGLDGFEFVEFTGPDPEALADLFTRMGFAHVADHRSKNVRRYTQGDINFLLNMDPAGQVAGFREAHGPSANAMAFRVADAQAALALAVERGRAAIAGVERAESRLAPMSVALRTLRTLTRGTSGDAGQAEPTA